jgi:TolB-like protein
VQAENPEPAIPDSGKQNIAVLDLEPRGGLIAEEVLSISDRLRGELINTGKYTVLERGQMDVILREQGFQHSGACSEASCIVEVGQLLAVHKMVGGSIGKVGKAYSINLKVIDVQSGKIERQVSDDIQASKEELISFHIGNVARKMAGLVKEKKPLTSRAVFWVPLGTALVGGGAAVAYLLLNSENAEDQESTREVQLEVPLQ